MSRIKLTAVILIAAVSLFVLCSCGEDRSGYMTGNCSRDGVAELIRDNPELAGNGFTKKTTYNVTPDGFGDIKLFKSSETAFTIVQYPGYSYTYVDISGTPGLISAVLCDAYGRGATEDILFTYCDDEMQTYGIGLYDGVLGYSRSVMHGDGTMKLYLRRQLGAEGMPDVYSVLSVSVTAFKNNPADLGCIAISEAGVVTFSEDGPAFSPDSGKTVQIRGFEKNGVTSVIVSTVDKTVTYREQADIDVLTALIPELDGGSACAEPTGGTTYIIAFTYGDGSVAYAYYNDTGAFKFHGGSWQTAAAGARILPGVE